RRDGLLESRQRRHDPISGLDDVRSGLPENCELHAAPPVGPAGDPRIFWAVYGTADVGNADGRAVPEAQYDVVVFCGTEQLVIVVDCMRLRRAIDVALGSVQRRGRNYRPNVLESEPD